MGITPGSLLEVPDDDATASSWGTQVFIGLAAVVGSGPRWVVTGGEEDLPQWTAEPTPLTAASMDLLKAADVAASREFGRASRAELRARWERGLRWAQHKHDPARGSFEALGGAIIWKKTAEFHRSYTRVALMREFRDEQRRDAATKSEAALARCVQDTHRMVEKCIRAYSRRWHVPGMTAEDLIGHLAIRLIEHFRGGLSWEHYEKPGYEATFIMFDRRRRALKKRRRIYEVTATGNVPEDLSRLSPTPEDLVAAKSERGAIRQAYGRTRARLSRIDRRWFVGLRADAEWYEDVNLARVAEKLDRSRSAASRAKDKIGDALRRELGNELREEIFGASLGEAKPGDTTDD